MWFIIPLNMSSFKIISFLWNHLISCAWRQTVSMVVVGGVPAEGKHFSLLRGKFTSHNHLHSPHSFTVRIPKETLHMAGGCLQERAEK